MPARPRGKHGRSKSALPVIDRKVTQLTSGSVLARNTIWNILGQGVPLLAAVVAIPAILKGLGTERFGALTLAWLLIGYFGLFDLGLGRALTKLAADRLGQGQDEDVPALGWTALLLMMALGVAAAGVIASSSSWLVAHVLAVPPPLRGETREALCLLAMSVPFVTSTTGLRGLLEAQQRFGLVNAVRVPLGVFTFIGPLLVLPFSSSLVPVVGILALGRFVGWSVHIGLCLRVFPGLRGRWRVRPQLAWALLRLGGWMTVTNVVGPLMVYLDRFLIAGLLGLAAVAYYAPPFEVVIRLLLVPAAIAQVFFPAFSASLVSDRPRTPLLFDRALKSVFLSLFPAVLLLLTLAPELLDLWLGAEFARESGRILQLLAAGLFFNGLAQIPFALVQGAGRADFTARLHVLELPFYLVAAWGLIRIFGVEGAAIAWAARAAVDAIILYGAAERLAPTTPVPSWRPVALFAALLAFGLGAISDTLLSKGVFVFTALPAFGLLSWLVILSPEERIVARDLLGRVPLSIRRGP